MKKFQTLDQKIEKIFRPIGQLGIVAIIAMMFLIVLDVAGRYFFNCPIVGSVEIVQLQNILLSFFALVWCTLNKEHINVSIMEKFIPIKVRSISDTVYYLLGAGFYSIMCLQNIKIVHGYIIQEGRTIVLGIPLLPIYFIIAFSCACVAILLLIAVIENIIGMVKK